MKLLFVANESLVRERLAGMIAELADVQIEIEEPGEAEVDRATAPIHPDIVLIDINHSHGRGLEIIRGFRALQGERVTVIMAIASSSALQYRASCLEAGAMYFFNSAREQDWLLESIVSVQEELG